MAKKGGTGVNVGSISILVIFVLLCLTSFASLSLVSANADAKLSRNAAKAMTAYYVADGKAEDIFSEIYEKCLKPASFEADKQGFINSCLELQSGLDMITVSKENDKLVFNYTVPIDIKTELQVSVEAFFADGEGDYHKLLKWQAVPIGEWEGDESLNVWIGE